MMMCKCSYDDNTWLHVLTNYIWAFKQPAHERHLLGQKFDARIEGDGSISLNVGYTSRLQCSAGMAHLYPGTKVQLDVQDLYRMAGGILYPEVHNEVAKLCVPGRIALQLLCLHAELGRRDGHAAAAYAKHAKRLWLMVNSCAENKTPFPFPGLGEYLEMWKTAKLPAAGTPLSPDEAQTLAWYPGDSGKMRGKLPNESDNHYWPCAPLQDRDCFPAGESNLYATCSHCCDPAKGPTGDPACFDGYFTFARCCRTPEGSGRFY